MASHKNNITVLALCALMATVACQVSQGGPQTSQGGPHQNQGRIRRQVEDSLQEDGVQSGPPTWVPCDFATSPGISCADCNTRLICKPVGGLLRPCGNPLRPHCNNGICSAVPAAGC